MNIEGLNKNIGNNENDVTEKKFYKCGISIYMTPSFEMSV